MTNTNTMHMCAISSLRDQTGAIKEFPNMQLINTLQLSILQEEKCAFLVWRVSSILVMGRCLVDVFEVWMSVAQFRPRP
jgi:hypothetical protein